jgi:RND family efflux transporter MFP subunit
VTVKGLSGAEFTGHVVDINPASIPGQRNFIARILVRNDGEFLRPGMSADVALNVSENAGAVVVPRDAVVEDRDLRQVYAVVDSRVEIREVEIGVTERGHLEIVSGVKPGDTLVVAGQADLADGERVEPVQRQGGAQQARADSDRTQ